MDLEGAEPSDAAEVTTSRPAGSTPDARPLEPDLERIAGDLADVERALERLDAGSYWTDEVTGEPLSDELHAHDPTARRITGRPDEPSGSAERAPSALLDEPDPS